jgi:hypothetical protein
LEYNWGLGMLRFLCALLCLCIVHCLLLFVLLFVGFFLLRSSLLLFPLFGFWYLAKTKTKTNENERNPRTAKPNRNTRPCALCNVQLQLYSDHPHPQDHRPPKTTSTSTPAISREITQAGTGKRTFWWFGGV